MASLITYLFSTPSAAPSKEPAPGELSGIRGAFTRTASAVAGVANRIRKSVLPTHSETKKKKNRDRVVRLIKRGQSALKAQKGEQAAPAPQKEQKPSSFQTAAKVAAVVAGVAVAAAVTATVAPTLFASSPVATTGTSALVATSGGTAAFTVDFDKLKEIAGALGANPRQLFELAANYLGVTPHPDLVSEAARLQPEKMGGELIPSGMGIIPKEAISPLNIAEFWKNIAPQIIKVDPPVNHLDIVSQEARIEMEEPIPHPVPRDATCPLLETPEAFSSNRTIQTPELPKALQEASPLGVLGALGGTAATIGAAHLTGGSTPVEFHSIDVEGEDGWKYQITIQVPPDQKGLYSSDQLQIIAQSIARGVLSRVARANPGLIQVGKPLQIDFPEEGGFAVQRQDQPSLAYTYKPNPTPQGAEKEYDERLSKLRNVLVCPRKSSPEEITSLKTLFLRPSPPSPRAMVAPPAMTAPRTVPQLEGANQTSGGGLSLNPDTNLVPSRVKPTAINWSGNSCFCSSPLWAFFTNEPAAYNEIPAAIQRRLIRLRSEGNTPPQISQIVSKSQISLDDFRQLEKNLEGLERKEVLSPVCKELLSLLQLHSLIGEYQENESISGARVNSMRQIARRVHPNFRDTGANAGDAHELFQILGSLLFEGSKYNQNLTITRTGNELQLKPDSKPNWGELLLPMPQGNSPIRLQDILNESLTPQQSETIEYRKEGDTASKSYEVQIVSQFDRPPPFLSLTLNRARVNGTMDMRSVKIDETITVQGMTYELVAVSRHRGSFAHYDAAVKKEGSWYHCDDNSRGEKVTPLEAKDLSKYAGTGYMFFYRRAAVPPIEK